ncbi:MAG: hypothetical protein J0H68_03450 [Sphingobacteriia bacterium]|nr:hypothetical protein [Sphingobacteriia bacterium]
MNIYQTGGLIMFVTKYFLLFKNSIYFLLQTSIILAFFCQKEAFAGRFCPTDLISDPRSTNSTSGYDCTCPDGQYLNFRMDTQETKLGNCRDNYTYKLDITKYNTGPILWLDAAKPSISNYALHDQIAFGAAYTEYFSTWTDRSGYANHANQAVVANRPWLIQKAATYQYGVQGHPRPFLYFQNTAVGEVQYMSGSLVDGASNNFNNAFTLFVVVKFATQPTTASTVFRVHNGGTTVFEVVRPASSMNLNLVVNDGTTNPTLTNSVTPLTDSGPSDVAINNDTHLAVFVARRIPVNAPTTNSLEYYLNPYQFSTSSEVEISPSRSGRQNWLSTAYAGNLTNFTGYIIGSQTNAGVQKCYQCHVGEIILFNRSLSHGERREIEMYLRRKWGIIQNLPSA